jgi:hypothetical protein
MNELEKSAVVSKGTDRSNDSLEKHAVVQTAATATYLRMYKKNGNPSDLAWGQPAVIGSPSGLAPV